MNQITKYMGLLAILPLVMVAISPNMIGEALAASADGSPGAVSPKSYGSATADIVCGDRLCSEMSSMTATTTKVTYTEMPEYMPTIETVQVSNFSGDSEWTFNAIYEVTAGDKNVESVMFLVESDTDSMLVSAGSLFAHDNAINIVRINANDPMTIMAQIVSFELND